MAFSTSACSLEADQQLIRPTATKRDPVLEVQLSERYMHTPLNDSSKQIRLCKILPGPEHSELATALRTVSLYDSSKQYDCLTYVWGDKSKFEVITVNTRRYEVTQNLYSILCTLRALEFEGDLWIDALCIDQDNNPTEKTEQVKLMGSIYSGGKGVLVGLETGAQDTAQSVGDYALVKTALDRLANRSHLHELDCFSSRDAKETDKKASVAFLRLLKSVWFTRTWTVQEICLSTKATLIFSGGTMSWTTLERAFRNWNDHRVDCCKTFAESLDEDVKTLCHKVYCHIKNIAFVTKGLRHEQHLLQPMLCFQHLDVTDDRDKFYAFRSLHTAGGDLPVPDYTKSTETVFSELAVSILKNTRTLNLLALDLHGGAELPSWVANLSCKPPIEQNYWRRRLSLLNVYDCARGLPWAVEQISLKKVCLRGILVDRVQNVTEEAFAFMEPKEHATLMWAWYAFANRGSTSNTSSEICNPAFCATMIGGCVEEDTGIREANAVDVAKWGDMLARLMRAGSFGQHVNLSRLIGTHITAVLNRKLFRTHAGRLGVGPRNMRSGDSVWIFGGGKAPFVLRHTGSAEKEHVLIGDAYVHEMMQGQIMEQELDTQQCHMI